MVFMVVEAGSAYNVILRRPTMGSFKAVRMRVPRTRKSKVQALQEMSSSDFERGEQGEVQMVSSHPEKTT